MVDSETEPDACMRAASAAVEVVREECSDMDVTVREVEDGMLVEMPNDVADAVDDIDNSAISQREFEEFVDDSEFIRRWLGGIVESRDVVVDPDNEAYVAEVTTLARSVFDEPFTFSASDLVGTETMESIAEAGSE